MVAITAAWLPAAHARPGVAAPPGCHPEWPVVAHDARGRRVRAARPVACVAETGFATSESTIGITPSGAIFYSPANTENTIARSVDHGATWHLLQPPEMQYTALWNTVDPYLTVDRRTGRVFLVHATGPTRTAPIVVSESPLPSGIPTAVAFASGFQVYATPDEGRTWRTADYSLAPMADWEKIFVGPPPAASSGAAQSSGYPNVVYVCANSPFEVAGPGRFCYKSLDGGATFNPAGYVFPSPTTPDVCLALTTNNGVVGNDGAIYQPISCNGGSYVAISRDEGATYTWSRVPTAPGAGSNIPGGVSFQIAIDHADNLYALWKANDSLLLVISRNRGRTWSSPMVVSAPGVHDVELPSLAAGPRGHVGVTYYATTRPSAPALTAYLTQTADALDRLPVFHSGALNDPKRPIFHDYGFSGSPRADYVGATYDEKGVLWAGVVKQFGPPDADGNVRTTGYVGRLAH